MYQNTQGYVAGTPLVWNSAGGSGGGGAITCTSLAAGAARQGAKSSSLIATPPSGTTAVCPDFLVVTIQAQFTSSPASAGNVSVYLGPSDSATAGTDNPMGLTGADAAVSNVEVLGGLPLVGAMPVWNSIGTGVHLSAPMFFPVDPQHPYLCPVIFNNASPAFDSTAAHTILTITPMWRQAST